MQDAQYRQITLWRRDGSIAAFALVDAEDFDRLNAFRWYMNSGYARRSSNGKCVLMHREILGAEALKAGETDHINRNRLDNRRSNLRVVTHQQNSQNRDSWGATSRFRAVYWAGPPRGWRARVRLFGKPIHLGYFDSEIDAALAVEKWRVESGSAAMRDPELDRQAA